MDLGLKGRKAILAGANASIGRCVAEALIAEGCEVAICGRTEEKVARVLGTLKASGGRAIGKAVDAADPVAFPAWVEAAAEELGGCDIFISFVSTNPGNDSPEAWETVFHADTLPFVRGHQAALPFLKKSDAAAIITLSSTGAVEEFMGPQPYNALKAALINYSAALAQKYAADGIRVNCITPGPIFTEDGPWAYIKENMPEFYNGIVAQIPMGRMGTGEELAKAIAFMASPVCGYMNGANLVVDGCFTKRVAF